MADMAVLTSRVLVIDDSPEDIRALKRFCVSRHLTLARVKREKLVDTISSQIELGAIVLAESYAGSEEETADLAAFIRATRPEIPIILRRSAGASLDELPDSLRNSCCAAFATGQWDNLQGAVDQFIFALVYPNAVVRGFSEVSESALEHTFSGLEVKVLTPYISRDRLIVGEVFSLIPLESTWFRGYMLLQAVEDELHRYMAWRDPYAQPTFHSINGVLSETTNLIWGGIKNRFIESTKPPEGAYVQVPIVVNHHRRYISFGSENPQLCFKYQLKHADNGPSLTIFQRFVFSLNWSPEEYRELSRDDTDAGAGDLELF